MSPLPAEYKTRFTFIGANETEVLRHIWKIPRSTLVCDVIMESVTELAPGRFGFRPDQYQMLWDLFDDDLHDDDLRVSIPTPEGDDSSTTSSLTDVISERHNTRDVMHAEASVPNANESSRQNTAPAPKSGHVERAANLEEADKTTASTVKEALRELPASNATDNIIRWLDQIKTAGELIPVAPPAQPYLHGITNASEREIIRYQHYEAENDRLGEAIVEYLPTVVRYAQWNSGPLTKYADAKDLEDNLRQPLKCWNVRTDERDLDHGFQVRDFRIWRDAHHRWIEFIESFDLCEYAIAIADPIIVNMLDAETLLTVGARCRCVKCKNRDKESDAESRHDITPALTRDSSALSSGPEVKSIVTTTSDPSVKSTHHGRLPHPCTGVDGDIDASIGHTMYIDCSRPFKTDREDAVALLRLNFSKFYSFSSRSKSKSRRSGRVKHALKTLIPTLGRNKRD